MTVINGATECFDEIFETDEQARARIDGQGNTLVAYLADWCLPCKRVMPSFGDKELRDEAKKRGVKVCYADSDELRELAGEQGICAIPTVVTYRNGSAIQETVGVREVRDYVSMIQNSFPQILGA